MGHLSMGTDTEVNLFHAVTMALVRRQRCQLCLEVRLFKSEFGEVAGDGIAEPLYRPVSFTRDLGSERVVALTECAQGLFKCRDSAARSSCVLECLMQLTQGISECFGLNTEFAGGVVQYAEACFELLQFSSDERKGRVEFGNIMQARARLTQ